MPIQFIHETVEMPADYFEEAKRLTEGYVDGRMARGDYARLMEYRAAPSEWTAYFQDAKGKMAEWAVAYHLHRQGWPRISPDTKVYEARDKTWEPDLPYSRFGLPDIAVKASLYASRVGRGASWTFQLHDTKGSFGRDPILSRGLDQLVALVVAPDRWFTNAYRLVAISPFRSLYHYLSNPERPEHIGRSTCLYEEDLKGPLPTREERLERCRAYWAPIYDRLDARRAQRGS